MPSAPVARATGAAALLCLLLLASSLPACRREAASEGEHPTVLTRVEDFSKHWHKLTDPGYPVRLRGVITSYDPAWGLFSIQDETGGLYVAPEGLPANLRVGQLVELEGTSGPPSKGVLHPRVTVLGEAEMPAPRAPSLKELTASSLHFSQWVETEGVVRSASMQEGRFTVELTAAGRGAKARVLGVRVD